MADATLKRLIELIGDQEHPELRRPAIQVAGAVGSAADRGLVKALTSLLDDPNSNSELRPWAIEALGNLKAGEALPRLAEFVRQGGPELESAARAAGHMGARGAKAMEKLMAGASPGLRRRIASALAIGGTDSAVAAAAHALLDNDPGTVDAAARSLGNQIPALSPSERRTLLGQLLDALRKKRRPPLPPHSEAALLRVLTAMPDGKAEEVFWSRLDRSRPAPVRAAALHALGSLPVPKGGRVRQLLECAADVDFQVAAPALMILKQVPVAAKDAGDWQPLLSAPDVATRRFAVEKLGGLDSPAVARALAEQLHHPDRALRDEVRAALDRTGSGRAILLDALLDAETPDEAWFLARAQSAHAPKLKAAQRARLFKAACALWDADDRRAEAIFFLLRESNTAATRDQIEARALTLRKKKDYARALAYLRWLARDPACPAAARFELAATGLKLADHDLAPEARGNEPSLAQFAKLLQDSGLDVFAQVKKAKWLAPEDLFYLGFHFAEQNRREKEFGGDVLHLVLERSPRSTLAKDAKRKIKREGLD